MKFRTQNHIPNLLKEIQRHHEENVKALYLYGEPFGPKKESNPSQSLLIIVNDASVRKLHLLKELYTKISRLNMKFTIFNHEEFISSLDVFPLEALEIKETGRLLYGTDILKSTTINLANLRLETEFYLRTNILKLRESFIKGQFKPEILIKQSFPMVYSLFRSLIALHPTADKNAPILEQICQAYSLDLSLFQRITQKWEKSVLSVEFNAYLTELEKLTDQIDKSIYAA